MVKRWTLLMTAGLILIPSVSPLGGQSYSRAAAPGWGTDALDRLDEIDYRPLEVEVRRRGLAIEDDELGPFVRRNFRFVFLNKINRDRFLVEPRPERIAERVIRILQLNRRLDELILEGRRMMASGEVDSAPRHGKRQLLDRIDRVARDLRGTFRASFLEAHSSNYSFRLPAEGSGNQFLYYLIEAEKINLRLTQKVNDYFLSAAPGAVSVSEYGQVSIAVLTESLIKLGRLVEKRL